MVACEDCSWPEVTGLRWYCWLELCSRWRQQRCSHFDTACQRPKGKMHYLFAIMVVFFPYATYAKKKSYATCAKKKNSELRFFPQSSYAPGGAAGPGPCMRPPPAPPPPPPPPGFERWWAGDMAPTAPPFFPPGANGAPFSSVSARFRKTRRYTNVVCCPDMLTANVSPRTRGPWHGMLPPTM